MLNELIGYTKKHLPDAEPGFTTRPIRWSVEIAADGRFLNLVPLGDGKRGEHLTRCPDMHAMNAGGKAHFLIESAQSAALLFKKGEDENKKRSAAHRHGYFVAMLADAADTVADLAPLLGFIRDKSRMDALRAALEAHTAKPTDWLTWRIAGRELRQQPEVQEWWRAWRAADLTPSAAPGSGGDAAATDTMVCFLSGTAGAPLSTHPKITGLSSVGGLSMGDVLIGFDKSAFTSYGLDKSANAAMSEDAAQQYSAALNDLIANRSYKLANTLVAYWYRDSIPPDDDLMALLMGMEDDEQAEASASITARQLLDAIRGGKRSDLGDNRFFALTLSGAAGRVMIRDWINGPFDDLAAAVTAWFDDLAIVAPTGHNLGRDPKLLGVCAALVRELKDLPPPTAATVWRLALRQLPIPQALMAQALARLRVGLVKDEPVRTARMGLIKAYFVRRGDKQMTAYLNPDHPEPAYHCGRLLAVLASLQRAALGDVGAGVVQRYYAAASQTPGLILGRLASNARNHLGKLKPGLAWLFEERIADVMSRLGDRAPRILDLEGQGLFALGYYQQLAALRADRKGKTDNPEQDQDQLALNDQTNDSINAQGELL
jgi:CRISPR-associated protein Csd1